MPRILQATAIICALTAAACGFLGAKSPKTDLFLCRVAALEPAVGDVLDAEQLIRDVYVGKASIAAALSAVGASAAEVHAVIDALQACEPAPVQPTEVIPA